MRKPIKTRKYKARKNRVRKHKTHKHKVRKHKTRKHRVRNRKTRKHRVRKHKGGGEGQPQESQSDCALKCQDYKVGDEIIYRRSRMGRGHREIMGTIVKIGKPTSGLYRDVCCYTINTQENDNFNVPCHDQTIRRPGEDVQEPVMPRGPGRNFGLNDGINPQQGPRQI